MWEKAIGRAKLAKKGQMRRNENNNKNLKEYATLKCKHQQCHSASTLRVVEWRCRASSKIRYANVKNYNKPIENGSAQQNAVNVYMRFALLVCATLPHSSYSKLTHTHLLTLSLT